MVKHIYSIACDSIVVDKDTNRASYLNTIDAGNASKLPAMMPPLSVGSLWQVEEGLNRFSVRIDRLSPSGKTQILFSLDVEVDAKVKRSHRTNIRLSGLPIEEDGINIIVVMLKEEGAEWQQVANLLIRIKLKKEETEKLEIA